MSNIAERLQRLEAERVEKEKREERGLGEAICKRGVLVEQELVDKLKSSALILRELKVEEILEDVRKVKEDLKSGISVEMTFSRKKHDRDYEYTKRSMFKNVSEILSAEKIFSSPRDLYKDDLYSDWFPTTLLEAKSLQLVGIDLSMDVRWDCHESYDEISYKYIYIEPKPGKQLKVVDGEGDHVLSENELKPERAIEDIILSAFLNPRHYFYHEPEQR